MKTDSGDERYACVWIKAGNAPRSIDYEFLRNGLQIRQNPPAWVQPPPSFIQAFETFCSVNDLLLDLADSLDDKARHMAVAIYQLSELGLMLVEKSLANEQIIRPT